MLRAAVRVRPVFVTHEGGDVEIAGNEVIDDIANVPLYNRVGYAEFAAYEIAYDRLIGPVIFLPTLVAIVTTLALLGSHNARETSRCGPCFIKPALLAATTVSTITLQAPQHAILSRGFHERASRALLRVP